MFQNTIDEYLSEVKHICDVINKDEIREVCDIIAAVKEMNGRIFFLGVGGSAANASHAVNDFRKILGIESYAVTDNVAELTARINDDGWNTCYSDWLEISNLSENDSLFVLSVGGGSQTTSRNLVEAIKLGRKVGSYVVAIVSRDGGYALDESHQTILIPSIEGRITPHAEEWQSILLHLIVEAIRG